MLISQISDADGMSLVVVREADAARSVKGAKSVYALALEAARAGRSLADVVAERGLGETVDLEAAYREGRVMAPIRHPDPAHLHLTGTGLTHLGSAATRDAMHKTANAEEKLTDSMKMFRMGLEGGKPQGQTPGVQPEWFYKGNGNMVVEPGEPLVSPAFALDAGEEPEIAGIYLIGDDGTPFRIGFALVERVFRPRHGTDQLSLSRPFEAAQRLARAGDPGRPAARRHPRHLAHPARRPDAVGEAVPLRRGQHVPHHRQSRAPPLQI